MGSFIISLDCEGKWGFADALTPVHHRLLTNPALAEVYRRLVRLFGRYELSATFAFVMAFTLTKSERAEFSEELADKNDPWLAYVHSALASGGSDGWFQPEALEIVREEPRHEVACHSFCHRPLDDASISAAGASKELQAAVDVARRKGLVLETFVYPRNRVGNLEALRQAGFLGYRGERKASARFPRATALASEFMRIMPQQPEAESDGLIRIPSGYFFNWRYGARRLVPGPLTVRRWTSLLDRTAQEGGVAHLWLHPHNLITAPSTGETLEQVLSHAARLQAKGKLSVLTQRDYCHRLSGAGGPLDELQTVPGGLQRQCVAASRDLG